ARARAAWATLDAAEKQKKADEQAKKDATTLKQLNLDYLRATGQTVEAAGAFGVTRGEQTLLQVAVLLLDLGAG
ncbi:hypothetical protein ACV334_32835, partial [Pseudomonas aeruginosa]